jgi:N-acetylglucosamine kinase-like BadF-type ATPase
MTNSYFLGIDRGGTKTQAVLIDESRREVARTSSGPSNIHSVGRAIAEASLTEAIRQALAIAGIASGGVHAVALGLAGAGRPEDRQVARDIVSRIAPFRHITITHDAETALIGGVGRRYGVVLIAGTGAIAYGVNALGQSARADGWGYLLGDDGSAYWIGREGLRAVARACDGRGRPTALQSLLYADLQVGSCHELVRRVYAGSFDVPRVASVAPLVGQAAEKGDAVACSILKRAGRRLGRTLGTVVRKLGMNDEPFEAVLAGGLLHSEGMPRDVLVAAFRQTAPYALAIEPRHDAAFGAALLAQSTGGEPSASSRRTLGER